MVYLIFMLRESAWNDLGGFHGFLMRGCVVIWTHFGSLYSIPNASKVSIARCGAIFRKIKPDSSCLA